MKLVNAIETYIEFQQSMGLKSTTARRTLRQYARTVGDVDLDTPVPHQVLSFLQGKGPVTSTWRVKFRLLWGFYRYAISRGYACSSPLPAMLPKFPPQQTPYIYSTQEIERLLEATSVLDSRYSRLQAPMFSTLIKLLYGSAIRVSEALSLTLRDVDLVEGVITVRDTKFHKSRFVPIGPRLRNELIGLADRRRRLPMPSGEDSLFFASRTGSAWPYQRVITLFQRVRSAANISIPVGELRPPRLHDLRHTAAMHRVIAWYQSGQDVQRLLPQLATYLGHLDIRSTQRYLQTTPALLELACQRFADYASTGDSNGE
jgi:site-specific recombinase XerD